MATKHNMTLDNQWFSKVADGKKTIEGRALDDKRKNIKIGDTIVFSEKGTNNKCSTIVTELLYFDDIKSMAETLSMGYMASLSNILPGVETVEEFIEIYSAYYKPDVKMIAIRFARVYNM